jgi:hypothetical protein
LPNNIHLNIYRVMQDRCRIPWKGGAKIIPLDVILPFVLLPILAVIASINAWCTFIVFLALPFLTLFSLQFFGKYFPNSKFFFSCTLSSGVWLLMIFEYLVIPHLEILPSENFVFLAQILIGSLFLSSAKFASVKSTGEHGSSAKNDSGPTDCRAKCPPDSMHCTICEAVVVKKEYHCWW